MEVGNGTPAIISLGYGLPDSNDLFIGAYPGPSPFPFVGLIDEPSVYDRGLSATEVQRLFTSGKTPVANDGVTVIPGDILDSLAAPVDTSALVAIVITAETGGMRIRTEPTGASIRINGRYYGRTPANLNELPAGPLRISLERQGYMPVVVEDRIEAGVVRTSRTTLLPVQGTISLSVRPFGDVYVGGELVQAGVQDSLELHLPPDTHLVSVRNPDFGEWRSTVIVTPGDPKVMSVDFTQTIRLIVTTFDLDGNRVESAEIMLDDKPTGSYTPGPVDIPIGVRRLEARIEGYEPAYPIEARNFDGSVSGPLRFILRKLPEDG